MSTLSSNSRTYLKSFIVGSSLPVFVTFFYAVQSYEKKKIINYSYDIYTILAPLYFGLMTTFAVFLTKQMKITLRKSLFLISILSSSLVISFITINNLYKFKSKRRWYTQYLKLTMTHLVTYNIIIYFILKNIC